MLSFSRDSEVLAPVTTDRSAGGQVIHAVLQGKSATLENTLVFPPSGVIPFHGFTMYGKQIKIYYSGSLISTRSGFLIFEIVNIGRSSLGQKIHKKKKTIS